MYAQVAGGSSVYNRKTITAQGIVSRLKGHVEPKTDENRRRIERNRLSPEQQRVAGQMARKLASYQLLEDRVSHGGSLPTSDDVAHSLYPGAEQLSVEERADVDMAVAKLQYGARQRVQRVVSELAAKGGDAPSADQLASRLYPGRDEKDLSNMELVTIEDALADLHGRMAIRDKFNDLYWKRRDVERWLKGTLEEFRDFGERVGVRTAEAARLAGVAAVAVSMVFANLGAAAPSAVENRASELVASTRHTGRDPRLNLV